MKRKERCVVTIDGVQLAAEYLNQIGSGQHLVRCFLGQEGTKWSTTDTGLRVVSEADPAPFEVRS